MNNIEKFYTDQINQKLSANKKLTSKIKIIGILRLVVVLCALVLGYISYKNDRSSLFFISSITLLAIFLILILLNSFQRTKMKLILLWK